MSRVLLASGDAAFRRTLRNALSADGAFDVCGETKNRIEAIERAKELLPDLVILEMELPPMEDFRAAMALKLNMPKVPVFLVTEQHSSMEVEKAALSHGIDAVFEKGHDFTSLVMNARAVCGLE